MWGGMHVRAGLLPGLPAIGKIHHGLINPASIPDESTDVGLVPQQCKRKEREVKRKIYCKIT